MTDMSEEMLRTLDRVVADTLTVAEREKADGGGMSTKLWAALAEQGMTALGELQSEIHFADAMALAARAAYHAAPIPLGETITARRLLSMANVPLPDGAISIAPPRASTAHGNLRPAVAYGRSVDFVVVASGNAIEIYQHTKSVTRQAQNQAGEPRDEIDLGNAKLIASGKLPDAGRVLILEGALLRSVELSGALDRALEHSLTWANERVQFGRPISKFQAIQHALAVMASEVASARAAVGMAIEASLTSASWFHVAVAKSRSGEAAGKVANAAHAAFGAMGFTREHLLHYTTRRLWAWRDEFGAETEWQAELGRLVARKGGAGLWPTLTEHG